MSVTSLLKAPVRSVGKNIRDLSLILGIGPKMNCDNRHVLEKSVFPFFIEQSEFKRVLFVGCHWYTWHYKTIFASKEFWTIEINPKRARYGSSRHIVDSIENIQQYFEPSSLDLVMMLGVIGWGLDDPQAIEQSLAAVHAVLRKEGVLMLGSDEVPEHTPVNLAESTTLRSMAQYHFPPLNTSSYRCAGDLNHTFTFFRKAAE